MLPHGTSRKCSIDEREGIHTGYTATTTTTLKLIRLASVVNLFDTRTLGEEGLVVDGLLTPFVRGLFLSFLDGRASAGVGGADGRVGASRCSHLSP